MMRAECLLRSLNGELHHHSDGNPPPELLRNLLIEGRKNKYTIRVAGELIASIVTDSLDERLPCMMEHINAQLDEDVENFTTQIKSLIKKSTRLSFGLQSPAKSDEESISDLSLLKKKPEGITPLITAMLKDSANVPPYNLLRFKFPWSAAENCQLIAFTIGRQIEALEIGFSRGLHPKDFEDEQENLSFDEYNLVCVRRARELRRDILSENELYMETRCFYIGAFDRKDDSHIDQLNNFALKVGDQELMRSLLKMQSNAIGKAKSKTEDIRLADYNKQTSSESARISVSRLTQFDEDSEYEPTTATYSRVSPNSDGPILPALLDFTQTEEWEKSRAVKNQPNEILDDGSMPSTQVPPVFKKGKRGLTDCNAGDIIPLGQKRTRKQIRDKL